KAWLPKLNLSTADAVVQIIDESNKESVYTIRIKGTTFQPKVFKAGTYTIVVGEGETAKTLTGITATASPDEAGTQAVKL
ncbi:MAG: hypothetical protein HN909_06805, partial [Phycisphaerales bacterium]|nr:hypothetical protein [Phycisphaerales bacterium]